MSEVHLHSTQQNAPPQPPYVRPLAGRGLGGRGGRAREREREREASERQNIGCQNLGPGDQHQQACSGWLPQACSGWLRLGPGDLHQCRHPLQAGRGRVSPRLYRRGIPCAEAPVIMLSATRLKHHQRSSSTIDLQHSPSFMNWGGARERLVFYRRSTSASTAPCTSRRMCCHIQKDVLPYALS